MADEDEPAVSDLGREIAEADGPPHPVELPDEPNPAAGLLGLLIYPLLPWRRRRRKPSR